MNTVAFSGWGQDAESLKPAIPEGYDTTHINYAEFAGVEPLFDFLRAQPLECELLVGWSLGGQIAVRLVDEGIIKPKKLVLIAPAFRFVDKEAGTPPANFRALEQSFQKNPMTMVEQLLKMMGVGSLQFEYAVKSMQSAMTYHQNWAIWLEELCEYSCDKVAFENFPRTLIIHGEEDVVTPVEQSIMFKEALPDADLAVIEDFGHAPHFEDSEMIKELIKNECAL